MNSQKNSFIFLETLVSLLVLSIIVSGFYLLSYNKENYELFNQINIISNQFIEHNYENIRKESQTLSITQDLTQTFTINVKKYIYEDNEIKLVQYELQ